MVFLTTKLMDFKNFNSKLYNTSPQKNETAPVVFISLGVRKNQGYRCKAWTFVNPMLGRIFIFGDFCGFGEPKCHGRQGPKIVWSKSDLFLEQLYRVSLFKVQGSVWGYILLISVQKNGRS